MNSVTNGLPNANTLAGKASTTLFSGSNTCLVANVGAPDPLKFLRQDGSWTAPAGATNGLAYLNDLNATNTAIRTGSQAVTNGLPDATTLAGKAATNQNVSLFPNDANYVTKTVTNGLPDANTLAGKASTNLFSGSNTGLVANAGAPDPLKFLRQDGSWTRRFFMRPRSTKNSSGKRDPEMHQTKKGNQWYFGAKAHIGVDSKETVVHSVAHLGGQRGRQAYAARLTARRRDARYGAMPAIKARPRRFMQPRRRHKI